MLRCPTKQKKKEEKEEVAADLNQQLLPSRLHISLSRSPLVFSFNPLHEGQCYHPNSIYRLDGKEARRNRRSQRLAKSQIEGTMNRESEREREAQQRC